LINAKNARQSWIAQKHFISFVRGYVGTVENHGKNGKKNAALFVEIAKKSRQFI